MLYVTSLFYFIFIEHAIGKLMKKNIIIILFEGNKSIAISQFWKMLTVILLTKSNLSADDSSGLIKAAVIIAPEFIIGL